MKTTRSGLVESQERGEARQISDPFVRIGPCKVVLYFGHLIFLFYMQSYGQD
jgi:hypothetical protein